MSPVVHGRRILWHAGAMSPHSKSRRDAYDHLLQYVLSHPASEYQKMKGRTTKVLVLCWVSATLLSWFFLRFFDTPGKRTFASVRRDGMFLSVGSVKEMEANLRTARISPIATYAPRTPHTTRLGFCFSFLSLGNWALRGDGLSVASSASFPANDIQIQLRPLDFPSAYTMASKNENQRAWMGRQGVNVF